jgi:hypothetical protein
VIDHKCSQLKTVGKYRRRLMSSNKTSNLGMRYGETRLATRGGLEAVQIGSDLIAFYPQAIHQLQPYVILLDPASGILKRLDLQATK